MTRSEPRVLHVLPHPGGGGETYVKQLVQMGGYRFETAFVAPGPTPRPAVLAGAMRAQLASRRCDLLHVHGEIAAVLCLPSLAVRPSVVTINGLHLVRRLDGWRRTLAEASLRLVVRAASRTICVGEAELGEVESVVRVKDRLVLIRNGVGLMPQPTPEERAAARAALELSATVAVGLSLGALDPHKEPVLVARAALDAARGGAPLVLLLAGEGPLRGELETIALAGDGTVVRLVGFQSDVRGVLAAADFFVLASRREGLSFALLEAMSLGLPPVVSDAPGNPEVVGDAGIVVPRGDVSGFRAAFERLALDEPERLVLGDRARRRVTERFDNRQMLERTRDVYDDVLGSAR
jgi:glycosyltransferase involved in cell wall biosynthesis